MAPSIATGNVIVQYNSVQQWTCTCTMLTCSDTRILFLFSAQFDIGNITPVYRELFGSEKLTYRMLVTCACTFTSD